MDIKEIAEKLNGSEYDYDIDLDIKKYCRKNRMVVVFGASDDLMEFRGAIDDEFYSTVYLNSSGVIEHQCDGEDCPYHKKELKNAIGWVEPLWCKDDKYSWTYKTNIPHEKFDIMEEDEYYCQGIVFNLDYFD